MRVRTSGTSRFGKRWISPWWLWFIAGCAGSILWFAGQGQHAAQHNEQIAATQNEQQSEQDDQQMYKYELMDGQLYRVSYDPQLEQQHAEQLQPNSSQNGNEKQPDTNKEPVKVPPINKKDQVQQQERQELFIDVYLTEQKKVERVPLETYIAGVLAAEMPIEFELEALKAQAIAARTYVLRRLELGRDNEMQALGADVYDSVRHQAYISKEDLQKKWQGEEKEKNLAKLALAAEQTKGQIVTYDGALIDASFFSTSNGYTENAADYWGNDIPYLRSVASPWDKDLSPRFKQEFVFKREELYRKLGLSDKASKKPTIKVIEKSEGKRIKTISINGKKLSGREVREKLGLASSEFTWKIGKEEVTFYTQGYGHGVGMSQWGANGMALEGKRAEQIIHHYYSGVEIEEASKLAIAKRS